MPSKHVELHSHNDNQHVDLQHIGITHNDNQHVDLQHFGIQHSDI